MISTVTDRPQQYAKQQNLPPNVSIQTTMIGSLDTIAPQQLTTTTIQSSTIDELNQTEIVTITTDQTEIVTITTDQSYETTTVQSNDGWRAVTDAVDNGL